MTLIFTEQLNQGHNANLRDLEEGTVKNNPLLALSSNFFHMDSAQSDSTSSDNETTADIVKLHEDKSKQVSSASFIYLTSQIIALSLLYFVKITYKQKGNPSETSKTAYLAHFIVYIFW